VGDVAVAFYGPGVKTTLYHVNVPRVVIGKDVVEVYFV
jgi:hypothetical protein